MTDVVWVCRSCMQAFPRQLDQHFRCAGVRCDGIPEQHVPRDSLTEAERRVGELEAALRQVKRLTDPDSEPWELSDRKQVLAMRDVATEAWKHAVDVLSTDPARPTEGRNDART
jgi:hypothetical protein